MLVELEDGCCRSCSGQLSITDVDDVSMHVECMDCDDEYSVETDAFGDGCMKYYLAFVEAELDSEEPSDVD